MADRRGEAVFQSQFIEDLEHWGADPLVAGRVLRLVAETLRNPTSGAGHPERLRHPGSDVWSRRITQEHRLVYHIREDAVSFLQARYHYGR